MGLWRWVFGGRQENVAKPETACTKSEGNADHRDGGWRETTYASPETTCAKCGWTYEQGEKWCRHCGYAAVPSGKEQCPSCGLFHVWDGRECVVCSYHGDHASTPCPKCGYAHTYENMKCRHCGFTRTIDSAASRSDVNGPGYYPRGSNFPNEGFVQASLRAYFEGLGFKVSEATYKDQIDLTATHPVSGECWRVEAKGQTSEVGLDFRTGLGQIVQRMTNPEHHYALAVPETDAFMKQCRQVSDWVRLTLRLSWFVIGASGNVRRVNPGEPL